MRRVAEKQTDRPWRWERLKENDMKSWLKVGRELEAGAGFPAGSRVPGAGGGLPSPRDPTQPWLAARGKSR